MRSVFALLIASTVTFAACAPASSPDVAIHSVHACTGALPDGGRFSCIEIEGTGMPTCNGGTLTDGPCDRSGTTGGCVVAQGAEMITTWYFDASTSTVQQLCGSIGGTFVAP